MRTAATLWIGLVIASGIVLDVILATNAAPNHIDTISGTAKWIGWHAPVLPFGVSMLVAHFWVNLDWSPVDAPTNYYLLAGVGGAWGVFGLIWRWQDAADGLVLAVMVAAISTGFASGAILWPQRPPSLHTTDD